MRITDVVVYEEPIVYPKPPEGMAPFVVDMPAGAVTVELSGVASELLPLVERAYAAPKLNVLMQRSGEFNVYDEDTQVRIQGVRTDLEQLLGRPAVPDPKVQP